MHRAHSLASLGQLAVPGHRELQPGGHDRAAQELLERQSLSTAPVIRERFLGVVEKAAAVADGPAAPSRVSARAERYSAAIRSARDRMAGLERL